MEKVYGVILQRANRSCWTNGFKSKTRTNETVIGSMGSNYTSTANFFAFGIAFGCISKVFLVWKKIKLMLNFFFLYFLMILMSKILTKILKKNYFNAFSSEKHFWKASRTTIPNTCNQFESQIWIFLLFFHFFLRARKRDWAYPLGLNIFFPPLF
jgi:hypothetical protein